MSNNDKTYYPEEIQDNPLPTDIEGVTHYSSGSNETYAPNSIDDKPIVKGVVARHLISDSLDTLSRRILNKFEFTRQGSIQIGEYVQGESGDVRISPNGIIARDQSGNETFALDATTGNATFKGTIRAGSLIAGDSSIVIDSDVEGHGTIMFFDEEENARILLGYGDF